MSHWHCYTRYCHTGVATLYILPHCWRCYTTVATLMLMLPNSIYCHNGIATLLVPHPVYCHTIGATWMSMLRNSICCHTIVATLLLPNSIYCHNGFGRLLLSISIYCHTVRIGPTVVFRCQNYRNVFNFYFFFQLMIYVFRPSTKKTLVLLR